MNEGQLKKLMDDDEYDKFIKEFNPQDFLIKETLREAVLDLSRKGEEDNKADVKKEGTVESKDELKSEGKSEDKSELKEGIANKN